MIFALLWMLFLMGMFCFLILPGVNQQTREMDYPRPGRLHAIQKMGEQSHWWDYRDVYGWHQSKDFLPPPPEQATVLEASAIVEAHRHIRTIAQEQAMTREIIGG